MQQSDIVIKHDVNKQVNSLLFVNTKRFKPKENFSFEKASENSLYLKH